MKVMRMRMLIALAFVSTADIESAFDDLVATLPSEATTVVNYFEDNYIGRPSRRGQCRRALFPITFWNCHDRVNQGLPRTNNISSRRMASRFSV